MKKKLLIAVVCLIVCFNIKSQTNIFPSTGAAGVGTISPDPSSLLEIVSTSKGILIPRMNKSQRDAIATPSTGLLIYQTNSSPGFYYYDGSKWTAVSPKGVNKSLSNLAAPTAVNVDLLSDSDNVRNIGSSLNSWKDIYLDGSLYLGGARFLAYQTGSGTANTAVGAAALNTNTTGYSNTAIGSNTLFKNTTGYLNVANGTYASYANTTGYGNVAIGSSTLEFNQTGNDNVAIGKFTSEYTKGSLNTAVGAGALADLSGNSNTALGYEALGFGLFGNNLVAVGDKALFFLSNSSGNCTAVGSEAGINNSTGSNNTYLGYHAGNTVTTGSSNTVIGYGADVSNGTFTNATAIGNLAVSGASNRVRIGNSSVTSIGGAVGWTNFSDERIKTNIKQNVPGLAFINLLKPVTYNFDLSKEEQIFKRKDSAEWKEKYDIQKIKFTGFLAQEVEIAAKKINYDFSGVDVPANDKDIYGLRYAEFVVPLVKAVQELSKMNDEKDSAINNLQNQINELKAMINANAQSISLSQLSNITLSNASLEQNIPNPFNHTTTIHYTLPQKFSVAQIVITNNDGKMLKQINISGAGKGSVNVDASTLSSGAYNYSLIVDGKLIATKQMERLK